MMSDINVVILGRSGSGKSTVARILRDALSEYGIESVKVVDEDIEIDSETLLCRASSLAESDVSIKISSVNAKTVHLK